MSFLACSEKETIPKEQATPVISIIKESVKYTDSIPTGRLPSTVRPISYNLNLTIDPDQESFSGHNEIRIYSDVETSHIFLHAKDLNVSKVQIRTPGGHVINATYSQMHQTGIAKISLNGILPKGNSSIIFDYDAPFNTALEALYKVNDGGKNYAFTQFEAVSARLAFPSFDEPAFKTPFETSLIIKNEHKGFSNTPQIAETDLGNGTRRLDFAVSKKLPTYLVAFAVGDLDVVEWTDLPANSIRKSPLPLRGIATKGKGEKLKYALENTQKIVDSLEEYFRVPYPYEKLDIVAVPDFAFGAMENAGLIVYREQLLLFDDSMSLSQMRRYLNVHAHELAHQWFGNLVTPVWWDDIWLNEAFATWMAYSSNDNIMPEQKFRQALMGRALGAMRNDSLTSARQIRQPILSNDDIDSAFDGITYSKGGGILRMFESFIGPEQFQNGITHYMNKYAFGNTTADDFITAIGEKSYGASPKVIRDAFNSFLEQPGIPYLDVNTTCQTENAEINISQSRYLPIGSKGDTNQVWQIPFCVSYETNGQMHKQCELVTKQQQSIKLIENGCPSLLIPNAGGAGYYRFALSSDNWTNIFVNQSKLSDEEMMAANDSFIASVDAGTLNFSDLMQVAPKVAKSHSARVATSPMSMLSFVYKNLATTEMEKNKLAKVSNVLYAHKVKLLGFTTKPTDTADSIQLRNSVLGFLAVEGKNQEIRDYYVEMAKTYTGYETDRTIHADKVDSNTIGKALSVAVEDIGVEFAQHLITLFEKETDGTIRGRLLGAISASKDENLAKEIQGWVLSEKIRDNEIYYILRGQMSEDTLRPSMWNWFKQNIEGVKGRVSSFSQNRIPGLGAYFCDANGKAQVEEFFNPIIKDISGGERALAQTLETIELCVAKKEHHQAEVAAYLKAM